MPKVSVIIPVYGVEQYIERCARSLFEQTLDDLEYIFIDDCTPDSSIDILKNVMEEYPHRKIQTQIVKMPMNSGLPAVRQYGIQLATGNYIINCDSDDWVDVQAYETLYNKAIEDNYDIVFCDLSISNGETHQPIYHTFNYTNKQNMLYSIVYKGTQWSLCGGIFKRQIFINNDIIYPKDNNGEDFALMLQLVYYSKKFYHIKKSLYYYYFNENSISRCQSIDNYVRRFKQHQNNVDLITRFFKRENIYKEYINIILILKLHGKAMLAPMTNIKEFRELWFNLYPELNNVYLLFKKIPFILKVKYWGVKTHTYHLMMKFTQKIKLNIR